MYDDEDELADDRTEKIEIFICFSVKGTMPLKMILSLFIFFVNEIKSAIESEREEGIQRCVSKNNFHA